MNAAGWSAGATAMQDAAPRLFDAAGADDCVDVLVNRRCSLLMCSDDGALLDRQAQMLLRNLRDVADVETAVLLEMDRGLLLDRFNRLLGEFSLEQARQRVPTALRVWILHVHSAAELNQARLLLRLAQDFPAAGVVMAMLGSVSAGRELAPEGSTRRLQVRVLTDFWSEMSRAVGPSGRTEPPLGPPPEQSAAPVAAPAPPAPPAPPPPRMRAASRAPWIGLGLLVASAAAVLWVQSRGGLDGLRSPGPDPAVAMTAGSPGATAPRQADPVRVEEPATAEATPREPVVTVTVAPPAPTVVAGDTPAPSRQATAGAVVEAAPTNVAAVPTLAPPSTATPATVAKADRPDAPAGKALPPPAPARPTTRGEEISSSVRWVQAQSPSGWLVQHGIDSNVGRLLDLRRSFPRLSESRVLALLRADGSLYYALVSGPFENAGDARGFIKDGADIPSLPWVRSIASLARELEERRGRLDADAVVN